MRSTSIHRLIALLAVTFLLVAACNNGNGDDAAPEPEPETTEEVDDTTTDDTTTDDAPDSPAEVADTPFCQGFYRAVTDFADLDDAFFDEDPGTAFADLLVVLDRIEPPSEVAEDWATLLDVLGTYAELLADIDPTDPESLQALDSPELEELAMRADEASDNLAAYARDVCGFDPDEI